MSFRRGLFNTIGFFDEIYDKTALRFETDFCLRAKANGFRLMFNPAAIIYHDQNKRWTHVSGERDAQSLLSQARNDILFILRNKDAIPNFSWIRFAIRQLLLMEVYAIRAALETPWYVYGTLGMLQGVKTWAQNPGKPIRSGQDQH